MVTKRKTGCGCAAKKGKSKRVGNYSLKPITDDELKIRGLKPYVAPKSPTTPFVPYFKERANNKYATGEIQRPKESGVLLDEKGNVIGGWQTPGYGVVDKPMFSEKVPKRTIGLYGKKKKTTVKKKR